MSIRVDLATDKPRRWADVEDLIAGEKAARENPKLAQIGDWIPHVDDLVRVHFVAKGEEHDVSTDTVAYVELNEALLPKPAQGLLRSERNPYYVAYFKPEDWKKEFSGIEQPKKGSTQHLNSTYFKNAVSFANKTIKEEVDFSGAIFASDANFSGIARFNLTTFSNGANFEGTTFSKNAIFENAKFTKKTIFDRAEFGDLARFKNVIFSGNSSFKNAKFTKAADFGEAKFSEYAEFDGAAFSGKADFGCAIFDFKADFNGATFDYTTDFSKASFKIIPPIFHGVSEFYSDTYFSLDPENWPAPSSEREHQSNYERLRYLTNKAMLHDAERFFERQIMRCKEVEDWLAGTKHLLAIKNREGNIFAHVRDFVGADLNHLVSWIYGALGAYGTSWARPLIILIFSTLGFAIIYAQLGLPSNYHPIEVSAANGLSLLGLVFTPLTYQDISPLLKLMMGIQSIISLALLFLFGLGVRSRFRVK